MRTISRSKWAAAWAAILAISVLCSASPDDSLTIIYSGGIRGRIAGCNCLSGPQGGLDRRESLLRAHFGESFPFGIDCGAFLDLDPEGGMARSRCTLVLLARQGLKVAGVSARDLYYGPEFLLKASAQAGVILVSANIVQSGKPLLPAWTTLQIDSTIIALTSIAERIPALAAPGGITCLSPDSALSALRSSRPKADLYCLLTDLDEATLRRALGGVQFVDIVITSNRQLVTATPFKIGNTTVLHPDPDGRQLEWLRIPRYDMARVSIYRDPILLATPKNEAALRAINSCLDAH